MALIDRLHDVNRRLPKRIYYRLYVNEFALGFVDSQLLDELDHRLFTLSSANRRIDLSFAADERQVFEQQLEAFFKSYFKRHHLDGWRNEYYAIADHYGGETFFLLERAALSYLGLTGHGVHINGYVNTPNGIDMWIAKRADNKPTAAGKLDQIAAGGQPYHLSLYDNVIKECDEEASIPSALAQTAVRASTISYYYDLPIGLRPDVIFNYDLCLPTTFVPQVNDGEVESFTRYPLDEILTMIAQTQQFKFNSAVVIIDFAMRHGVITPSHPEYLALQRGLARIDNESFWQNHVNT